MEKNSKEEKLLIEAIDLLRNAWNLGVFEDHPLLRERLSKLLEVKEGEDA